MKYNVGQEICLWRLDMRPLGFITVIKEVIVRITETKVGTPGEFSGTPSALQSLKGVDSDGNVYFKHWDRWPELRVSDFSDVWTARDDPDFGYWVPVEAVHIYNSIALYNAKDVGPIVLQNANGGRAVPKGDVVRCDVHDQYMYRSDDQCFVCYAESLKRARPV